jgi:hypothetical protein
MGAKRPELNPLCLKIAALVLGLFTLGRFIGLFAEGVPNDFSIIVHLAEFCAFAFSATLIWRSRKSD